MQLTFIAFIRNLSLLNVKNGLSVYCGSLVVVVEV